MAPCTGGIMEDDDFDCYMIPDGYCMAAGSEYCDFECPYRDMPEDNDD